MKRTSRRCLFWWYASIWCAGQSQMACRTSIDAVDGNKDIVVQSHHLHRYVQTNTDHRTSRRFKWFNDYLPTQYPTNLHIYHWKPEASHPKLWGSVAIYSKCIAIGYWSACVCLQPCWIAAKVSMLFTVNTSRGQKLWPSAVYHDQYYTGQTVSDEKSI